MSSGREYVAHFDGIGSSSCMVTTGARHAQSTIPQIPPPIHAKSNSGEQIFACSIEERSVRQVPSHTAAIAGNAGPPHARSAGVRSSPGSHPSLCHPPLRVTQYLAHVLHIYTPGERDTARSSNSEASSLQGLYPARLQLQNRARACLSSLEHPHPPFGLPSRKYPKSNKT